MPRKTSRQPTIPIGLRWVIQSFLVLAAGCVYDAKNRCDENETLSDNGRQCLCAAGTIMTAHGCTLCGANEVPGNETCDCAPGYSRVSPGSACEQTPSALGTPCDVQASPCLDSLFPICHVTAGTTGYCTKTGCATAADCVGGFACDTSAAPPYCKRPPLGAGKACQSAADCVGTEATFCDLAVTHMCHVEGCQLTADNCFPGTQCCDLTAYGVPQPICALQGMCPK